MVCSAQVPIRGLGLSQEVPSPATTSSQIMRCRSSSRHRPSASSWLLGRSTSVVGLLAAACLIQLVGPTFGQQQNLNQASVSSPDHLSSQQSHHVTEQQQLQTANSGGGSGSFEQLALVGNQPSQMNQISVVQGNAQSQLQALPMGDSMMTGGPRSRSPRSIGDMFKKFFNGNKRSKGSQGREWDQQQQQQQQQQVQHQHQQNQAMAAMAAAAANQHAVYASPFSAYSPQTSASALYPQFSPYYSTWPTTANLAQALRASPTLIGGPSTMALTGSSPLYAAASQSYNSYVAPPAPQGQVAAQFSAAAAAAAAAAAGNPQTSASHQHPSAVPPPPGMNPHQSGTSALDFHQVLDALVRTSGFAPAGDQEAAAATGYGSKTDGTPVFSFKKLVSLPFYLSTEEKPLDGLANAMGPGGSAGYSLHSMPIMRRHVRRMSTPSGQQLQQQQQQQSQLPNLATLQSDTSQMQRSERAQQQHFSNYLNAINNQIASMSTNSQLMQYLSRQQSLPSMANQMDAYSAEAALANYNTLASLGGTPPYKASGIGNRASNVAGGAGQMQMAASMITPMAVQPPPQALGQHQYSYHHHHNNNNNNNHNHHQSQAANNNQKQQQYEHEREIQSLLNSMQQQLSANSDPFAAASSPFTSSFANQAYTDGHRFGSQQQQFYQPQQQSVYPQQQQTQHYYWPSAGNQLPDGSGLPTINSNGNANNGQEYALSSGGQSGSLTVPAHGHLSTVQATIGQGSNSNGVANQMGGVQGGDQQQQQQQVASSGVSQSSSASSSASSSSGNSQVVSNVADGSSSQQQSALGTQQQTQPQVNLAGGQRDSNGGSSSSVNSNNSGGANNANNYGPAQQIEGQQK